MSAVTITKKEATAHFSRYLDAVEHGDTVVIVEDDRPVAQLVPVTSIKTDGFRVGSPRLRNPADTADFVLKVEPDAKV